MSNPFERVVTPIEINGRTLKYYSLPALEDERLSRLPFSIRVLLESAVRNCDGFNITEEDVTRILDWEQGCIEGNEVSFKPARVILQDFTGVPAVVDLAAMRDAVQRLGGNPEEINPAVPVDLVIDHSVQVDRFGTSDAVSYNLEMEFHRNKERFVFLKWGANAFKGLTIVPPGAGIVHQVNLEYLARVVFDSDGVLYPDSLVGTDSHTPMINGLGIVGWGVGGIEAEAVICNQPISMVLPKVVGYKLNGRLGAVATATDLVLEIVKNLRAHGVVGKFVEFYGPGVATLSLADRATISNMAPEYGATIGFFATDEKSLDYLRLTGRSEEKIAIVEQYLRAQGLFRDYNDASQDPAYTETLELDLQWLEEFGSKIAINMLAASIKPCLAGPKRPHDYIALATARSDFLATLSAPVGFKGFGLPQEALSKSVTIEYEGESHTLTHGSVAIAAITSCTNTSFVGISSQIHSNPNVMIAAGLLAKRAVEKGLRVKKFVKTSLAPGSGVVTQYLAKSDLLPFLSQLGFDIVGYGCTTCIGNSGPLPTPVHEAIEKNDLVCCGVLSGNRNFEGRIHPVTRANFLASPPLVVAYALAGTMVIDFETEPIGKDESGNDVFLRDIWPSHEEVAYQIQNHVLPSFFKEVYATVTSGTPQWNALEASAEKLYPWDPTSTYVHSPPFFASMGKEPSPKTKVENAYCLLNLGDSITTDHISPAGSISIRSPAARYLMDRGVERRDFNSYGSRRGNDEVMARGTFANIRLRNKFIGKAAPKTVHLPSEETLDVYDAAERYIAEGHELIILAGAQYGSGSSRDWAAKGVWMQNVKAVIAVSYERIHRSNLVLFGVMPLQFKAGDSADSLGLTGKEQFSIDLGEEITPRMDVTVRVTGGSIESFVVMLRVDTEAEVSYYKHGGVLNYVIRSRLG